jgi:hypothetical protein
MLAGVSEAGLNYDIASDSTIHLTHMTSAHLASTSNMATGNGEFVVACLVNTRNLTWLT